MQYNNFEKDIKNTFDNFKPEIDNDEIWDNIEPKLKKKKKRRFFFIWFLLGGLAVSYWAIQSTFLSEDDSVITQKETSKKDIEKSVESIASPPINTELDKTLPQEIISTTDGVQLSSTKKVVKEKRTIDNPIFTNQQLYNQFPNPQKTNPKPSLQLTDKGIESTQILNQKTEIVTENPIVNVEVETEEENKKIAEDLENQTTKDKFLADKQSNSKIGNAIDKEEKDQKKLEKQTDSKSSKKKKDKKKKDKKEKKKKEIIRPNKRKKWQYEFQSTVAPVYPIRQISKTFGNGSSSFIDSKKSTEKQLEAFAIDMNFGVQKRNGLVMVLGFQYQRFNEKFDQSTVEQETNIREIETTIVENSFGDVIRSEKENVPITTTITRIKKIYNSHQFYNIPFGIGKSWRNKKFDYVLVGGLQYNMVYQFEGTILDRDWEALEIYSNNYERIFRKRAGWGIWLSGEYRHHINKRLDWVVAPKIQIPMRSLTTDESDINQRYYPVSLNLGINYLLNPKKKKTQKK